MTDKERRLGEAIRNARIKKGYTQEMLAEMLEVTPVHLKNIEGSRRKPSVPLLFQLMELLDFSVDEIVFDHRKTAAIHVDGLNEKQIEALSRLVDTIKN